MVYIIQIIWYKLDMYMVKDFLINFIYLKYYHPFVILTLYFIYYSYQYLKYYLHPTHLFFPLII